MNDTPDIVAEAKDEFPEYIPAAKDEFPLVDDAEDYLIAPPKRKCVRGGKFQIGKMRYGDTFSVPWAERFHLRSEIARFKRTAIDVDFVTKMQWEDKRYRCRVWCIRPL